MILGDFVSDDTEQCKVKPILNGHLKINKMKVESIADLHEAIIGIENQFLVFFLSGRLRQVVL